MLPVGGIVLVQVEIVGRSDVDTSNLTASRIRCGTYPIIKIQVLHIVVSTEYELLQHCILPTNFNKRIPRRANSAVSTHADRNIELSFVVDPARVWPRPEPMYKYIPHNMAM